MTATETLLAIDEKEQRLADTEPDFEAAVRVARWLRNMRPFVPNGPWSTRLVTPAKNWPKEDLPA